jgi:hypothetical protein
MNGKFFTEDIIFIYPTDCNPYQAFFTLRQLIQRKTHPFFPQVGNVSIYFFFILTPIPPLPPTVAHAPHCSNN